MRGNCCLLFLNSIDLRIFLPFCAWLSLLSIIWSEVNIKAAFTYQNISKKNDVSSRLSSNNEDKNRRIGNKLGGDEPMYSEFHDMSCIKMGIVVQGNYTGD